MFSGIIEACGNVAHITEEGTNRSFWIESGMAHELRIDQSIAHNGVCLTVEEIQESRYRVTAIEETLRKTNLGQWQPGDLVNLERCLRLGDRLDGHIVQGHVDATGQCISAEAREGSWLFRFRYPEEFYDLLVEKGSIAVNGTSLTAFECTGNEFSVAIIPYTYNHTNFHRLRPGDTVNLEFDILGKYILRARRVNE